MESLPPQIAIDLPRDVWQLKNRSPLACHKALVRFAGSAHDEPLTASAAHVATVPTMNVSVIHLVAWSWYERRSMNIPCQHCRVTWQSFRCRCGNQLTLEVRLQPTVADDSVNSSITALSAAPPGTNTADTASQPPRNRTLPRARMMPTARRLHSTEEDSGWTAL